MKIFKSRQDHLINAITIVPLMFVFIMMFIELMNDEATLVQLMTVIGLPTVLTAILLLSRPKYSIDNSYFYYKAGLINGKIAIENIRKIEVGKTLWVGFKPATARKGLIVHYNKYDEIYISPDSNENFINELLQYNPNIHLIRTI
ncbi:hypothetical protein KO02_21155 [Sphingobacterium sp. ML3W]|nr:hypothetical protein KO02_21155 [Sphingobacterium sp. ML3W]